LPLRGYAGSAGENWRLTGQGLCRVEGCELDTGQYPSGIVVSDQDMAAINIKRAEFHGEWNYTISPNTYPPNCALIC
jgi:hypothetical protein